MKFSPLVALALGAVLAAVEAVQLQVLSTNAHVHDALTLAITVLAGLGVQAASPSAIAKAVPHAVLVVGATVISALSVIQGSFGLSGAWTTVVSVVLVILNTWLTEAEPAPSPAQAPIPAAQPSGGPVT